MVYHTARILLAKPFLMNRTSDPTKIPEGTITATLAQSVCTESAISICLIAQKYRQTFGGFQLSPISATHCTLSAATILLGQPDCVSNRNRLRVCLTVLDELGGSWCPARIIGGNLRRLCPRGLSEISDRIGSGNFQEEVGFGGIESETHTYISPGDSLFQWDELADDYALFDILNQDNWS